MFRPDIYSGAHTVPNCAPWFLSWRSLLVSSKLTFAFIAAALVVSTTPNAFAQGKGGLNRALGGSSNAGGARGIGNATNGLSRAGGKLARGNQGLNKAASGLARGPKNVPTPAMPAEVDPALTNQQRILDKRFQQADHLRGISERNGNERLLGTADRMEASATRNFERRTGTTLPPPPTDGSTTPPTDGSTTPPTDGSTTPPTDGSTTPPPTDGSVTPPSDGTAQPTAAALETARLKTKPSGFWFKSR